MLLSDDMRARMMELLPHAINTNLQSYRQFLETGHLEPDEENPDISKNFKSHHDACKAALAHIDLLIKLAKAIESPAAEASDKNDQAKEVLMETIQNAMKEINATQNKE